MLRKGEGPGLSRWNQYNHKGLDQREAGWGGQIDRRQAGGKRQISRWSPVLWRKKPGTKDATPEAGRGSEMDSPKSCQHPDFSPVRSVSDFSPQNRKAVNVCCFGVIGSSSPGS